jgi:hypothetical protein
VSRLSLAFRVQGGLTGRRRLIDGDAALRAYAACDAAAECESEAYLSAFRFPEAFRQRADNWDYLDVTDHDGIVGGDRLPIDIDREDNLQLAQTETRRLVSYILDRYQLDDEEVIVSFSGGKGFHVEPPLSLFAARPSPHFHRVCRVLAVGLAERAGIGTYGRRGYRPDEGIFDRVRPWRAINSRHLITGLYARHVTIAELMGLPIGRIKDLATEPAPFDVPELPRVNDQAAADWHAALQIVQKEDAANVERKNRGGPATLNRLTRDIIYDGADVGHRHRLIFSAAANMAEFNTVDDLIEALLTEPALNCGLTRKDVSRQIRCGIKHGRKGGSRGK